MYVVNKSTSNPHPPLQTSLWWARKHIPWTSGGVILMMALAMAIQTPTAKPVVRGDALTTDITKTGNVGEHL